MVLLRRLISVSENLQNDKNTFARMDFRLMFYILVLAIKHDYCVLTKAMPVELWMM